MSETRSSVHVYNARCALTVEPVRNRRGDTHTANFETASRVDAETTFAWESKLVVQLTGGELPDVVAVLLGHRPHVEFLHHGPRRDKGYRCFRDGGRLVVQVFATGERHSVALGSSDRLAVSALLFRQLQRNHGGLAGDVLYAMLTDIYAERVGTSAGATTDETSAARPGNHGTDRPAPVHAASPANGARTRDPSASAKRSDDDGAVDRSARDAYDW